MRGFDKLGAGVESVVYGPQVGAGKMGVDLGGSDVGVTKHGLHSAQVGPPFHHMGGEGMAKLVRGDLLADSCGTSVRT